MDLDFAVNVWFLISLCLFFLIIGGVSGLLLGVRFSRSNQGRYYH